MTEAITAAGGRSGAEEILARILENAGQAGDRLQAAADEKTEASPYAIPTALLGLDADPLPVGKPEKQDEPEPQTEEQQGAEAECGAEPEADEPETKADDTAEEAAQEDERQTAEQEQGEQA